MNNNKQYRTALDKLHTQQMELPCKQLQEIANNTRPIIKGNMLSVMHASAHEEHLSQLLERNNNQFKVAITFLTGYRGIFNVENSNNKISR